MRCPSCGSEYPDDADRCPECGAVPDATVSDREEAAGVDVVAKVWTYNGRSMVELARTPERVRRRRIAVVSSVASSLLVLFVLFLLRLDYSVSLMDVFPLDGTSMSFLDARSMFSNNLVPMLALVLAVLGLFSPIFACFSNIAMFVSALTVLVIDVESGVGFIRYSLESGSTTVLLVTVTVSLVLSLVGIRSMVRTLTGGIRDRRSGIPYLGLNFNIGWKWNRVVRKD